MKSVEGQGGSLSASEAASESGPSDESGPAISAAEARAYRQSLRSMDLPQFEGAVREMLEDLAEQDDLSSEICRLMQSRRPQL